MQEWLNRLRDVDLRGSLRPQLFDWHTSIKPKQQFMYIVDYYNISEGKLARSIIEENNNLTINTTLVSS
jgi:hypothetical protein